MEECLHLPIGLSDPIPPPPITARQSIVCNKLDLANEALIEVKSLLESSLDRGNLKGKSFDTEAINWRAHANVVYDGIQVKGSTYEEIRKDYEGHLDSIIRVRIEIANNWRSGTEPEPLAKNLDEMGKLISKPKYCSD